MRSDYSKEQAIHDLEAIRDNFLMETGGSAPLCLDYAIQALQEYDTEYAEDGKLLKKRSGDYVTYKVDWLLSHLAQEIYLMEALRKWKETNHDDA